MRTPEHRAHPGAGKKFEADLEMHYLSPGAFTVLPLDTERIPEPPPAPAPYRFPTANKRHRHHSFAIVGELASSRPNSRSPSPSGRVSPFRGHGFNPAGSRHASPSASPVPPDDPSKNVATGSTISRIPKLASAGIPRKPSTGAVFGEKVNHVVFQGLSRQASQSLTSLEERHVRRRPPPSPRKRLKGVPAFKELSPIQGSSPEPSHSLSSPSRIPTKSQSTPPSRFASPTRERSRVPARTSSKPNVAKSRDPSPLTSPTKIPIKKYQHVQSKVNSYTKPKVPPKPPLSSDMSEDSSTSPKKKVLSRKNSINRTPSRPNLLPKTFMANKNHNYTSDSSDAVDSNKPKTVSAKTFGSKVTSMSVSNASSVGKTTTNVPAKTNDTKRPANNTTSSAKINSTQPKNDSNMKSNAPETPKPIPKDEKKVPTDFSNTEDGGKRSSEKSSKVDLTKFESDSCPPTAAEVVSSTTNAVTKPLKIETPKLGRTKTVSPMIDGRVLSATSVSQAINKMNDTVLNTKTLIKDSGFQNRVTPANNAVTSTMKTDTAEVTTKMSEKSDIETKKVDDKTISKPVETADVTKLSSVSENVDTTAVNNAADGKTAKIVPNNVNTQPPQNNVIIPPTSAPTSVNNNHASNNNHTTNNHVTTIGLGNAKAIEREVQNNMNKLLGSMDSSLGDTPVSKMSANDRIREARTVIAADVKPIRITVREKPSEVDVQSGNVAPHFGVANGIGERPSLPPSQQHPPPDEPAKEEPPPNRCKRFLSSCTKVLSCNSCQKCKRTPKAVEVQEEEKEEKTGCFKCLSKKGKKEIKREQVRINIEDEDGQTKKKKIWQKLNCCKKNRIGDTQSCFPIGKRKESWVGRKAGSFLESEIEERTKCCSKQGCRDFFRKAFCGCRKKKEEPPPATARKESMVSSKKKSLTPTSVPPPEEIKPKIDASLVEHNSHMKGAIPVLPVWLAWFCCIMNCIGPGTGTVLSGLFCLCIGKPRFSQKDGPKPRIGAFIIDLIIGFSQFFTVLFCLVGWGWSIWWGVIMVKVAKKHRKLKHLEKLEENASKAQSLAEQNQKDLERGRT